MEYWYNFCPVQRYIKLRTFLTSVKKTDSIASNFYTYKKRMQFRTRKFQYGPTSSPNWGGTSAILQAKFSSAGTRSLPIVNNNPQWATYGSMLMNGGCSVPIIIYNIKFRLRIHFRAKLPEKDRPSPNISRKSHEGNPPNHAIRYRRLEIVVENQAVEFSQ